MRTVTRHANPESDGLPDTANQPQRTNAGIDIHTFALELEWKGPGGSVYKSFIASFLTLSNHLIVKQTDYCVPIPVGG